MATHPAEVKIAHAPLLSLLTELMENASAAGELRSNVNPARMAVITMQTVMSVAEPTGITGDSDTDPITTEELWDFLANGFVAP